MTHNFAGPLRVLAVTDDGLSCETPNSPVPFWLPRRGRHVLWERPPAAGQTINALVPGWLVAKHRQLAGDVEFERVRHERQTAKEQRMNDKPADVGNGALFKNDKKEKPSHPDYRGDCTIKGRKFWVSGWIKEGQKGKYMSLAFRLAEETSDKAAPASKAAAFAPENDIPF